MRLTVKIAWQRLLRLWPCGPFSDIRRPNARR